MATFEQRGDKWRVRIQRKVGDKFVFKSKTCNTRDEARRWAEQLEGKISGDEFRDRKLSQETSLAQACQWFEENCLADGPNAKNVKSRLKWWKGCELKDFSIASLTPADLISLRRVVLDEDDADDGETCGPEAQVGPQQMTHRLNTLSQVVQKWALSHNQTISNPVVPGVRPKLPRGRDRRLDDESEEWRMLNLARGARADWLRSAIVISIETACRQSELAGLRWERVKLDADYPYFDLPKTKNDRARHVPLSRRAIAAFRLIGPKKSGPVLPVETGRGIAHAFRTVITDELFPELRWHDLRHEAISRLFEFTDLRDTEIQAIVGHLSPEMLTRYAHLRADRLGVRLRGGQLNGRQREVVSLQAVRKARQKGAA